MKVSLLFPPTWHPSQPYLSLPSLKGFLAQGGVTNVSQRDLGIELLDGRRVSAHTVILTTGTFLNGLIHIGEKRFTAGRNGEAASIVSKRFLRSFGKSLNVASWNRFNERYARSPVERRPQAAGDGARGAGNRRSTDSERH